MELDRLKKAWNSAQVAPPATAFIPDQAIHRVDDIRSKIVTSHRRLGIISCVMAVVIWGIRLRIGFSISLCACYSLFMAACACMAFYYISRVNAIDLATSTVRDALVDTTNIKILYNKQQIAGILLGIPLIYFLLYELWNNQAITGIDTDHYMFIGGCVGAAVGAVIGLTKDRYHRMLIRNMREQLQHELDDGNDSAI